MFTTFQLNSVLRLKREQGWRSGENARLPPMCPGFDSWTRRHMWVEFVVGSPPCSERFFSGYSGFPLSSKTNISNRPRSIYQYSNMGPRLSGLTSIFGVVFFVSKSPVGIERQKKLEKFAILTRKPRSHA